VADNPRFAVCDCEINRPGPSYSIDTIRALRQGLPEGVQILFVMGADAVLELPEWREPDAILAESQVVAVRRPGFDLQIYSLWEPMRFWNCPSGASLMPFWLNRK